MVDGKEGAETVRRVRLLLADDSQSFRNTIKLPLSAASDIELVGEAEDGKQALSKVEELDPDVVLMDISMPRMNGFEATRRIKTDHPETGVVILTVHSDPAYENEARAAHADGFLDKRTISPSTVVAAVLAANHR